MRRIGIAILLVSMSHFSTAARAAGPPLDGLGAECRSGQVFITWNEGEADPKARYVVRSSPEPITAANVSSCKALARLAPGSANDWWLNPVTYGAPLEKDPKTGRLPEVPTNGFIIRAGGKPLHPASGLFVHTATADDGERRYYAVTFAAADGKEQLDVSPGINALRGPVSVKAAAPAPIWLGARKDLPRPGAGKGLPLHLALHAKRGRGGMDYLAFGDASLGWREGLPFKFGVRVTPDAVVVVPTDRTWIDRLFPEGTDECQRLTPALHSFWYGYNSHINNAAEMDTGVATNYTERRLLYILRWVQDYYRTDPNRTYCTGSSMGGCGAIVFALHHPEIFAGIRAFVPIVEYHKADNRGDSETRVVKECGPLDRPCSEGMPVWQRLSGTWFVKNAKEDLPFLVISNGRQDKSIPWNKVPDFYRAMNDRRQAFIAAWDNGAHSTAGKEMPEDVKRWGDLKAFHRLALNRSYLAFSNSSANENPGNGDPADGDVVGYMNRWLAFDEPVDTRDRYEVVIRWEGPADKLPVTVDVTPRRRQNFRPQPGAACQAQNLALDTQQRLPQETLTVEPDGLLTVKQFRLTSAKGNRLTISSGR